MPKLPKTKKNIEVCERFKEPKSSFVQLMTAPQVKSWRALLGAFQYVFSNLEKGLTSEGYSMSRFQILLTLYFDGPHSAINISRKLLVTRGNVSTFLKRLLADGLVEASDRSKSGKRPLFCLTDKGIEIFESVFPRHIDRVKSLMPKLDASVIETLSQIPRDSKN
ncbi:MAG: hypothetical protein COT74_00695 [Bdellovibrionales bacterium CG10_big_fil_rev_8_21_14_0_10_45_34]|nr:MAG: hypothetical protein COT74_00695 [Bdellovibrionales bacterium CG10_big_fil_rev_8_21_14_0_10_45_34]